MEYLHELFKFDWRGGTLSTPLHVSGAQTETEDHFDQVLFVLLASNLLSVKAWHMVRAIMYIKSTLSTKLAKKFHELWVIEEQRDQAAHCYPLLLTVQAFLTTYVSLTMKDNQLKAMSGLHWLTTVASTEAAVEELFAQCTKMVRATRAGRASGASSCEDALWQLRLTWRLAALALVSCQLEGSTCSPHAAAAPADQGARANDYALSCSPT